MKNLVIFELENQQYALPCDCIMKIVNAVAITPLPHVPKKILGIINVHGEIAIVIDIRRVLELPKKELELSDKIIIAKTDRRLVAFVVNTVKELAEFEDEKVVKMQNIISDSDIYDGTLKSDNGLIMIYNVMKFLSLEDNEAIENALNQ